MFHLHENIEWHCMQLEMNWRLESQTRYPKKNHDSMMLKSSNTIYISFEYVTRANNYVMCIWKHINVL
jgi:hypothetical protein